MRIDVDHRIKLVKRETERQVLVESREGESWDIGACGADIAKERVYHGSYLNLSSVRSREYPVAKQ
jgi:hypothetical protein